MRASKIIAAVLSLTLVAGASVPFGSYVPGCSLTAVAEDKTAETDDLAFTVFSDHAEVSGINKEGLTKCTIPSSVGGVPVTGIAENAFYFADKLQEITIPASVTYIGDTAFSWCLKLTAIKVDSSNKNFADINGVLFNKAKDTIISYPAGKTDKTYTTPDSVKEIDSFAFLLSQNLEAVTVSKAVSYIGQEAFCSSPNLKSVTILNPDCEFEISCFICNGKDDKGFSYYHGTITGYEESTAEKLAADNNYKFVAIPRPVTTTTTTTTTTSTTTTTTKATTTTSTAATTAKPATTTSTAATTAKPATTTSTATTTTAKPATTTTKVTTTTAKPATTTTKVTTTTAKPATTTTKATTTTAKPATTTTKATTTTAKPATTTTKVTTVITTSVPATTTTAPVTQLKYKLGDVDNDGRINASDASYVLQYYALHSTGKDGGFSKEQQAAADVDKDGSINAIDASIILSYYAYCGTTKDKAMTFEEYIKANVK